MKSPAVVDLQQVAKWLAELGLLTERGALEIVNSNQPMSLGQSVRLSAHVQVTRLRNEAAGTSSTGGHHSLLKQQLNNNNSNNNRSNGARPASSAGATTMSSMTTATTATTSATKPTSNQWARRSMAASSFSSSMAPHHSSAAPDSSATSAVSKRSSSPVPPFGSDLMQNLADGVILCHLLNRVRAGSIDKVNINVDRPWAAVDNINRFLAAALELGIPEQDLFEVDELYRERDWSKISKTIVALGQLADKNGVKPSLFSFGKTDETQEEEVAENTFVKYVAAYAYAPEKADELELNEGDIIDIENQPDGGWWFGKNASSGKSGWFPSNYATELTEVCNVAEATIDTGIENVPEEPETLPIPRPREKVGRKTSGQQQSEDGADISRIASIVIFRNLVLREMMNTEKAYTASIEQFISMFRDPLSEESWFPKEDLEAVFGNIDDVLSFQRNFCDALNHAIRQPYSNQQIGNVFLTRIDDFISVYSSYCGSYSQAVKIISQYKHDAKMKAFLIAAGCTLDPPITHILSFLIKPVQRICRYHLLIKELIRNTRPDHIDHALLTSASLAMEKVTETVNEIKRKKENVEMLQDLSSRIEGWEGPGIEHFGELLLDGPMKVISSDSTRAKNRYVFLLEKIIVVLNKDYRSQTKYRLRERVPLRDDSVVGECSMDSEDCKFGFSVTQAEDAETMLKPKCTKFFFLTEQQRDTWLQEAQKQLQKNHGSTAAAPSLPKDLQQEIQNQKQGQLATSGTVGAAGATSGTPTSNPSAGGTTRKMRSFFSIRRKMSDRQLLDKDKFTKDDVNKRPLPTGPSPTKLNFSDQQQQQQQTSPPSVSAAEGAGSTAQEVEFVRSITLPSTLSRPSFRSSFNIGSLDRESEINNSSNNVALPNISASMAALLESKGFTHLPGHNNNSNDKQSTGSVVTSINDDGNSKLGQAGITQTSKRNFLRSTDDITMAARRRSQSADAPVLGLPFQNKNEGNESTSSSSYSSQPPLLPSATLSSGGGSTQDARQRAEMLSKAAAAAIARKTSTHLSVNGSNPTGALSAESLIGSSNNINNMSNNNSNSGYNNSIRIGSGGQRASFSIGHMASNGANPSSLSSSSASAGSHGQRSATADGEIPSQNATSRLIIPRVQMPPANQTTTQVMIPETGSPQQLQPPQPTNMEPTSPKFSPSTPPPITSTMSSLKQSLGGSIRAISTHFFSSFTTSSSNATAATNQAPPPLPADSSSSSIGTASPLTSTNSSSSNNNNNNNNNYSSHMIPSNATVSSSQSTPAVVQPTTASSSSSLSVSLPTNSSLLSSASNESGTNELAMAQFQKHRPATIFITESTSNKWDPSTSQRKHDGNETSPATSTSKTSSDFVRPLPVMPLAQQSSGTTTTTTSSSSSSSSTINPNGSVASTTATNSTATTSTTAASASAAAKPTVRLQHLPPPPPLPVEANEVSGTGGANAPEENSSSTSSSSAPVPLRRSKSAKLTLGWRSRPSIVEAANSNIFAPASATSTSASASSVSTATTKRDGNLQDQSTSGNRLMVRSTTFSASHTNSNNSNSTNSNGSSSTLPRGTSMVSTPGTSVTSQNQLRARSTMSYHGTKTQDSSLSSSSSSSSSSTSSSSSLASSMAAVAAAAAAAKRAANVSETSPSQWAFSPPMQHAGLGGSSSTSSSTSTNSPKRTLKNKDRPKLSTTDRQQQPSASSSSSTSTSPSTSSEQSHHHHHHLHHPYINTNVSSSSSASKSQRQQNQQHHQSKSHFSRSTSTEEVSSSSLVSPKVPPKDDFHKLAMISLNQRDNSHPHPQHHHEGVTDGPKSANFLSSPSSASTTTTLTTPTSSGVNNTPSSISSSLSSLQSPASAVPPVPPKPSHMKSTGNLSITNVSVNLNGNNMGSTSSSINSSNNSLLNTTIVSSSSISNYDNTRHHLNSHHAVSMDPHSSALHTFEKEKDPPSIAVANTNSQLVPPQFALQGHLHSDSSDEWVHIVATAPPPPPSIAPNSSSSLTSSFLSSASSSYTGNDHGHSIHAVSTESSSPAMHGLTTIPLSSSPMTGAGVGTSGLSLPPSTMNNIHHPGINTHHHSSGAESMGGFERGFESPKSPRLAIALSTNDPESKCQLLIELVHERDEALLAARAEIRRLQTLIEEETHRRIIAEHTLLKMMQP